MPTTEQNLKDAERDVPKADTRGPIGAPLGAPTADLRIPCLVSDLCGTPLLPWRPGCMSAKYERYLFGRRMKLSYKLSTTPSLSYKLSCRAQLRSCGLPLSQRHCCRRDCEAMSCTRVSQTDSEARQRQLLADAAYFAACEIAQSADDPTTVVVGVAMPFHSVILVHRHACKRRSGHTLSSVSCSRCRNPTKGWVAFLLLVEGVNSVPQARPPLLILLSLNFKWVQESEATPISVQNHY